MCSRCRRGLQLGGSLGEWAGLAVLGVVGYWMYRVGKRKTLTVRVGKLGSLQRVTDPLRSADPISARAPSHRAKLIVCFATVYLVWGSTYLVASIGVHALPPFLFGGIRFICAGILLGLMALALGQRFELDAHRVAPHVHRGARQRGHREWRTNVAMQHVASNQTAILNASAALWIALLATRGRRAHALDRRTLIGLVIGFAGAALIIWPRGSLQTSHFGMQLLILVAVFAWSVSTVYIRNVHSKLDVLSFTAVQMLLGGAHADGARASPRAKRRSGTGRSPGSSRWPISRSRAPASRTPRLHGSPRTPRPRWSARTAT